MSGLYLHEETIATVALLGTVYNCVVESLLQPTRYRKMSESPDKVDSFDEDEAGTLVLVNAEDLAVGSVSFADRVASLSTESSKAIHRTASLYVFEKTTELDSARLLLSSSNSLSDSGSDQVVVRVFLFS